MPDGLLPIGTIRARSHFYRGSHLHNARNRPHASGFVKLLEGWFFVARGGFCQPGNTYAGKSANRMRFSYLGNERLGPAAVLVERDWGAKMETA